MHRFKDHQLRVGCVRAAVADTQINRWRWCDRTLKLSFSLLLGDMLWSLCKILSHLRSVALKMWNIILLQVGHAGIRLLSLLKKSLKKVARHYRHGVTWSICESFCELQRSDFKSAQFHFYSVKTQQPFLLFIKNIYDKFLCLYSCKTYFGLNQ